MPLRRHLEPNQRLRDKISRFICLYQSVFRAWVSLTSLPTISKKALKLQTTKVALRLFRKMTSELNVWLSGNVKIDLVQLKRASRLSLRKQLPSGLLNSRRN